MIGRMLQKLTEAYHEEEKTRITALEEGETYDIRKAH